MIQSPATVSCTISSNSNHTSRQGKSDQLLTAALGSRQLTAAAMGGHVSVAVSAAVSTAAVPAALSAATDLLPTLNDTALGEA